MAVCFFFNDTATTEIYTLSLHDALPICQVEADDREQRQKKALRDRRARHGGDPDRAAHVLDEGLLPGHELPDERDRKSTRLNSSHANISYAVFCLKKKTIKLFTSLPPAS